MAPSFDSPARPFNGAGPKSSLKRYSEASPSAHGDPSVGHRGSAYEGPNGKRKLATHAGGNDSWENANKKPRTSSTSELRKRKSVTFGDTPTKNSAAANSTKTTAKPGEAKKSKGPAKKPKPTPTVDTKPALEYLRLWKSSREAWKFNKNHQSTLIKAVFETGIPAADIPIFYDYIQDLKGFVRTRLRKTAMEIQTKDRTEGAAVFPAETTDVEAKQATYETILSEWLASQHIGQKRTFDEAHFITTVGEPEVVVRRAIKRMRAEMVIDALFDAGNETDHSAMSITSDRAKASNEKPTDSKPNGVPGKRRRKLRVSNLSDDDTSSSSESESDSDSDTSSSGSSSSESDSDDDDEEEDEEDRSDDDSSSSSSSSSSDSDSDDEDSSADESESEKEN